MLEFVEHLFTYQFLNRALITSIIVEIICDTVGNLIVLRGLSLVRGAMSHAVLPGVALSFLSDTPMFVGTLITGMVTSIFIGYITSSSKTRPDVAIGISFTAFLASGIIIISLINTTTNLYHALFDNLLTITNSAFLATIVIGLVVLILIIIFYRPLMTSTFDPAFSGMSGLNMTLLRCFVMLLLSLVTIASVQAVGIILVIALLITPASIAFLISKKLYSMMIITSLIGVVSSVVGPYYSHICDIPSDATIVLCAFVIYIITLFFAKFTNKRKRESLT